MSKQESHPYPNPNNIKVGDVVRLKSGSRRMCVVYIDDFDEVGDAHCQFSMDGMGVRIKPKRLDCHYHVAALRKCWFGVL